jgi:hypothetical protein
MQGRQRYSHHMNAAIHMCETWHLEHKCDGHVIHTCNHHISNWSLVCDLSEMPVMPLSWIYKIRQKLKNIRGGDNQFKVLGFGISESPKEVRILIWFDFHELTLTPLCRTWQKTRWSKVLIFRVKDIPDPALPCVQGWLTLYLPPSPETHFCHWQFRSHNLQALQIINNYHRKIGEESCARWKFDKLRKIAVQERTKKSWPHYIRVGLVFVIKMVAVL